jgi:hypothetical protein
MTSSRKKGELSETTKNYLLELYLEKVERRKKILQNKYLTKGTFREDESIDLYTSVYNDEFILKNKKTFENEFVKGTPDLIFKNKIVDIKTSWDIFTFLKSDAKEYYWQLQAYMWLTGREKGQIAFCLINNTEEAIMSEQYRQSFHNPYEFETQEYYDYENEVNEQIERNMTYNDLRKERKVKVIDFDFCKKDIELLQERILQCREYLKQIKL